MRLAKRSSYVTLFFTVLSFWGIVFFRDSNLFMYDISLALFGSSLLAFIIAFLEYFSQKKEKLSCFYHSAYTLSEELAKLFYYHIDGKRKEVIERVEENYPDILITDCQFLQDDKELSRCIDSYIAFLSHNFDEFRNNYADIDFMLDFKFFKKWIDKNVYSSLIDILELIKTLGICFQFYSSSGHTYHCLKSILVLNNCVFKTEYGANSNIMVYNEKYTDISENIERMRCKIYGQKFKPKQDKHIVFLQVTHNIEI